MRINKSFNGVKIPINRLQSPQTRKHQKIILLNNHLFLKLFNQITSKFLINENETT